MGVTKNFLKAAGILASLFLLTAILPAAVVPNATLSADQLATRFLAQATFGASPASLAELQALSYNYDTWITQQAALPQTLAVDLLVAAKATDSTITTFDTTLNRRARNQVMLAGTDQLRQRVAYALSQILVISDQDSNVAADLEGSSSYYDMLARNALGNFRTLLMDVTRHPMMGRYLSHYKNRKANTTTGTRPDENYAREVMQLFTIGLYQLNADGTFQLGTDGKPIEVYTNDDITEMARVFTGFMDANTNTQTNTDFPSVTINYTAPMRMWAAQHDIGSKKLLSYTGAVNPTLAAISATETACLQDVQNALDNLFNHPNTAPFICRQLIQRLVTSNPTNAYVGRVAAVFVNNGSGIRGDLLAVVRAILLDPEARNTSFITDAQHGKLQEPFLRLTQILRAFNFSVSAGTLPYDLGYSFSEYTMGQFPLGAPSVFNFYAPDYSPPGAIEKAGLDAPEFQILNSVFGVTFHNSIYTLIYSGSGKFSLNLTPQETLAASTSQLIDNLDLFLTHGTMSTDTRTTITTAVNKVTNAMVPSGSTLNMTRARLALHLATISPDFAILK